MSTHAIESRPTGIPGLLVLASIIVVGILTGAAYFHYKAPRLKAELSARIAAAPKTAEGRLKAWHVWGEPNIHRRLSDMGRYSEQWPWLITHAVKLGPNEVELWGIACAAIPHGVSHIEGMLVVVDLPAPRALARTTATGDYRAYVPVFPSAEDAPDPSVRLAQLARHLLEGMPDSLAKDIEGASIEFRIQDSPPK